MNDITPWTSIDLYYKGFHIKKSVPDTIKANKLKETIDLYIEKGFEPSWNKETTEAHNGDPDWIKQTDNDLGNCAKCGAPNAKSKKGNVYCSEKCWLK